MQSSKLNMIGQYVHIINKLQIQLKMLLTTQKKGRCVSNRRRVLINTKNDKFHHFTFSHQNPKQ